MKTNTKIEKQLKRKTNTELVETIIASKKNIKWRKIAEVFSGSRKNRKNMNLEDLEKEAKQGEIIVIPGKVLSQGELNKKIKIRAFDFSEKAKEKLKSAGCDFSSILEEIKSNPKADKVRIIK